MGFCDLGTGIGNGRASVQTFNFRKRSDLNFLWFWNWGFHFFSIKSKFIVLEALNLCFLKFGIVINIPERLFFKNGVSHLILSFDKQDGCSSH